MACFVHEKEKRGECLSKMEQILQQAVAQGKLPPTTDTWLAVQALNSYLIGMIYEWLVDPDAYDLGAHAPTMIDIFLCGLVARPPLKPVVSDATAVKPSAAIDLAVPHCPIAPAPCGAMQVNATK